ncbi:type II and III secretion system protein [uncultured Campylobacter sp.]|uniref:type II secretion system protein GspD n=1 Tax=uncultured Campylobacter sp. TaxID=218934 RepID=UPI00261F643A|nr:type II and III secretion system protein [uncultured Campylobacter sp.]
MKRILLALVLSLNLLLASEVKLNLLEFANLASVNSNTDILISDDINPNNFYFYTNKQTKISISLFRKAIEVKGLRLVRNSDFYYVENKALDNNGTLTPKAKLRYLELKNNTFDDVSKIIKSTTDSNDFNSTSSKVEYIKSTNSVVFKANDDDYNDIIDFAQRSDKRLEQVNFKLTILETNLNNAENIGTNLNSLADVVTRADFNYFVNLITMPYTAETNVVRDKKKGFYGVLNLLVKNDVTSVKQSPYLVAKNGTPVYFSSVKNIPYLKNTSTYSNASTTTQNTYDYRDVGLKVSITPTILKDHIDFDLDLVVEDILDETTLTPQTSKKELKSNYSINKGEILVLSGINKETAYEYRNGIPLLKDIPIIQYLFSIKQKVIQKSVITLTIEAF